MNENEFQDNNTIKKRVGIIVLVLLVLILFFVFLFMNNYYDKKREEEISNIIRNAMVQDDEEDKSTEESNGELEPEFIGAFEKAEYSKYNSYASDNGLGDTLIYIDGNVLNQTKFDNSNSDIPLLALVVEQEDGNRWCVSVPSNSKIKEIEGKNVRIFGTYRGFSDVMNLPTMAVVVVDNENMDEARIEKEENGEYVTVWKFSDYAEEENTETEENSGEEQSQESVLIYEDDKVKISFAEITEKGVTFWVENLTDVNITVQADSVSVNGISTSDIMMSDDVAPKSKGKVVAKCDDFPIDTKVEKVSGQLRIVDFSKSFNNYNATFSDVSIE